MFKGPGLQRWLNVSLSTTLSMLPFAIFKVNRWAWQSQQMYDIELRLVSAASVLPSVHFSLNRTHGLSISAKLNKCNACIRFGMILELSLRYRWMAPLWPLRIKSTYDCAIL
ncbi:hypothetical protein WICPIJ_009811 [Wickerhamomyces pijperi]|uniref:Uncharacterized protein n=1 Tax=Wickerhamomyces pijperi TaxID=599730 RepID=A0A9P8PJG0_WICPI|nr:hypothetical protein WICPIJ_009811 [Wickerhamomyces pijperi]